MGSALIGGEVDQGQPKLVEGWGGIYMVRQLFPLLFYLYEGRWTGPGYADPSVSYLHSPRLRLRVSDVSFHRK